MVAHLDLDDPSRVQQAQSFTGTLPQPQAPPTHGEKLHQLFQSTRAELENILAGYSLPEPYFRPKLQESIERLMTEVFEGPCSPTARTTGTQIYPANNSFSPLCTVPIKYQYFVKLHLIYAFYLTVYRYMYQRDILSKSVFFSLSLPPTNQMLLLFG